MERSGVLRMAVGLSRGALDEQGVAVVPEAKGARTGPGQEMVSPFRSATSTLSVRVMPDWRDGLDERTCEADACTKMMDRPATRSRVARPAAARRRYYVYVVELDDAVGPRRNPRYPSAYVGQSVVPPKERLRQHKDGYRSSRHVRKHGRASSPGAVSALQPDGHPRRSRRDGAGARQAPAESRLHGVRGPLSGACSCANCCSPWMRPWSTPLSLPVSLAPDLGVAPGQPYRWTLNQRWRMRTLASWDHIGKLEPALSSTNGHWRRNPATGQRTNLLAHPAART
jgi:hypothetical protein